MKRVSGLSIVGSTDDRRKRLVAAPLIAVMFAILLCRISSIGAEPDEWIIADWEMQDNVVENGYRSAVESVISELGEGGGAGIQERLDGLSGAGDNDSEMRELYLDACHERRLVRLEPHTDKLRKLIYIVGARVRSMRGGMSSGPFVGIQGKHATAEIRVATLEDGYAVNEVILPRQERVDYHYLDVSYDGRRILFTKSPPYKLFEMDLVTKEVRQLSSGPGHDQDACYLPNGNIVFNSDRAVLPTPCTGRADVQNLYFIEIFPPEHGERFWFPYPLDEERFLVGYVPTIDSGTLSHMGLYYFTLDGRRELLVYDSELAVRASMPLMPREEPTSIPSHVDYRKTTGTFSVNDVYAGQSMKGVARGTVKKLRVIEILYGEGDNHYKVKGTDECAGVGSAKNGISVGDGTWAPKKIFGEATVHEDGSAYFEVPARTPLFFQAIDAEGRMVQTMRTWATLQPNEHFSCLGCHEDKTQATPPPGQSMALNSPAQKLDSFYGMEEEHGFSYERHIQPIWDSHCTECHNETHPKGLDLQGEKVNNGKLWGRSYCKLAGGETDDSRRYLSFVGRESTPRLLDPAEVDGAKTSFLIEHLTAGHKEVQLSKEEMDKICCWIDLGIPYYEDYTLGHPEGSEFLQDYLDYKAGAEAAAQLDLESVALFVEETYGPTALRPHSIPPSPSTASGAKGYSIVLRIDNSQRLVFSGVNSKDGYFEICSASGRRVARCLYEDGIMHWNGKAKNGRQSARGVYVVSINGEVSGTFVIP